MENDPTYNLDEINANPIWKRAFQISEMENDNAPIGWSQFIKRAKAEVRKWKMKNVRLKN